METGSSSGRSERRRKTFSTEVIAEVARMMEEERISNTKGSTSVRHVVAALDKLDGTVHKVLRKNLQYHPYKMSNVLQLLLTYFPVRPTFSLDFLARCRVDVDRTWNILWNNEANFHLDGAVNTHNCRICGEKILI